MKELIDLHVHTVNSDGENTPLEVIKEANLIGIKTIAITDHDCVNGVEEGIKSGEEYEIKVIPGVEITAYDDREIHVLGYNIDYKSKIWKDYEKYNLSITEYEKQSVFKILAEIGIPIKEEELATYFNGKDKFRYSYVAKWLFDHGYGDSAKDAYSLFFLNGPLEHIKNKRINVEEAIKFIHFIGGTAVMAHPVRLGKSDINEAKEKIIKYSEWGLDGVEAVYSMHSDEQIDSLISFCNDNRLIITMGSDFHGIISKPHIKLGYGINNNLNKYQKLGNFIINQKGI